MSLIIQNNNILKTNFWHAIFQKINNDLNENINIYLNLKILSFIIIILLYFI